MRASQIREKHERMKVERQDDLHAISENMVKAAGDLAEIESMVSSRGWKAFLDLFSRMAEVYEADLARVDANEFERGMIVGRLQVCRMVVDIQGEFRQRLTRKKGAFEARAQASSGSEDHKK